MRLRPSPSFDIQIRYEENPDEDKSIVKTWAGPGLGCFIFLHFCFLTQTPEYINISAITLTLIFSSGL